MKRTKKRLEIGILGCGAIGSRIAKSVKKDLKSFYKLSGLFDIDIKKASYLEKSLKSSRIVKKSLNDLIKDCDFIVEAVNSKKTPNLIYQILKAKKGILAMSVGKLLGADKLFKLAKRNNCPLLIPSGAISGIDAIKAATNTKIKKITLTSKKPPKGFRNIPLFTKRGIDPTKIKKETILFKGNVKEAVRLFPQNINVAATLALASQNTNKILVQIITSPKYKNNSHEIEIVGDFGRIYTLTENIVCPDNPKTSYLAVLSGIQTLKQHYEAITIGT